MSHRAHHVSFGSTHRRRSRQSLIRGCCEVLERRMLLATFTVTNTSDDGIGSLREAITQANLTPDLDQIVFDIDIPGQQVHVIQPNTPLPGFNFPVEINGYSQEGSSANTLAEGSNAVLRIRLDGYDTLANGLFFGLGAGGSRVRGLMITGFTQNGILLITDVGGKTQVDGNFIGTDGVSAIPNATGIRVSAGENQIGGPDPENRNVISGNSGSGIAVAARSCSIEGNLIGSAPNGIDDMGNGLHGVSVIGALEHVVEIGGRSLGQRNVISGNSGNGVLCHGVLNGHILNNFIGVGVNMQPLFNSMDGVRLEDSHGVVIGGPSGGANVIAYNGGDGVDVSQNSLGNPISQNSIFSNDGLGIDLDDDDVTENDNETLDSDNGSNEWQNFPEFELAELTPGLAVHVKGTLISRPNNTYRIEFFSNDVPDPSGHGEGRTYIDFIDLETDPNGHAEFDLVLPNVGGSYIAATATRGIYSYDIQDFEFWYTSEFSECIPIVNRWVSLTGGSISAPENWSALQVPGPNDYVLIPELTGEQTIIVDQNWHILHIDSREKLTVDGVMQVDETLQAQEIFLEDEGSLQAGGDFVIEVDVSGGVAGNYTVDIAGDALVGGNLTCRDGDEFKVAGSLICENLTIDGTVDVEEDIIVNVDFIIGDDVELTPAVLNCQGNLFVGGSFVCESDGDVDVGINCEVGDAIIDGSVAIAGNYIVHVDMAGGDDGDYTVIVGGDALIDGGFDCPDGAVFTLTGSCEVGGSATVDGSLEVGLDTHIGGTLWVDDSGEARFIGALHVEVDVIVDGLLDADGATTVGGQMVLNKALDGNGSVEAQDLVVNDQSTMTGPGPITVPATATLQWNGKGDIAKNLVIFGGASFLNANMSFTGGQGVTIGAGGNAIFSGSTTVNGSGSGGHITVAGSGQVQISGPFVTVHGSAPSRFNVNQNGIVLVTTTGIASLGSGGDIDGQINGEGAAQITIAGVDPYNFGAGWGISGAAAGQVNFGLTQVNVTSPGSASGNISINNTNFNAAAAMTFGASGAGPLPDQVLARSADPPVTTTVNWLGGVFGGSGKVIVASGTTFNITGSNPHNLSSTLDLHGQANWTSGALTLLGGSDLNVLDGGSFNVETADTLNATGGTGGGDINVLPGGEFIKRGAGTVRFTRSSAPFTFNNSSPASVIVEAGTLALGGGGTHTGHFDIHDGAVLQMEGPDPSTFAAGWSISGDGGFAIVGGTHSFATGTIPESITASLAPNSVLSGAGDLTIAGTLNWTGGEMTGNGKTIIASGATLNISGANSKTARRVIDVAGAGNWTGGNLILIGGTFNVLPEGTFVADTESTLQATGGTGTNLFSNAGTFTKSGTGSVQLPLGSPITFSNVGTVNVDAGTLSLQSGVVQHNAATFTLTGGTWNVTGTLTFPGSATIRTNAGQVTLNSSGSSFPALNALTTNSGSLALTGGRDFTAAPFGGTFTNDGTLTLGPGSRLNVTGAFTQSAMGTLDTQLTGATPDSDFGEIVATGAATVGGTMIATLVNDYDPGVGTTFPIVGGGSRVGMFAGLTAPTSPERQFNLQYTPSQAILAAVDEVAPVVATATHSYESSPNQLAFAFSENVQVSLSLANFNVDQLGVGELSNISFDGYDSETNIATFTLPEGLADGNYRASFPLGVFDVNGNPLSVTYAFDFFVLIADANRDRHVDTADFNALAANFNKSAGVTFSSGDFNDDGRVNALDFNALASRYGTDLAPPEPLAMPGNPGSAVVAAKHGLLFSDQPIASRDVELSPLATLE